MRPRGGAARRPPGRPDLTAAAPQEFTAGAHPRGRGPPECGAIVRGDSTRASRGATMNEQWSPRSRDALPGEGATAQPGDRSRSSRDPRRPGLRAVGSRDDRHRRRLPDQGTKAVPNGRILGGLSGLRFHPSGALRVSTRHPAKLQARPRASLARPRPGHLVPVRPSGPTLLRGWGRSSSAATVDSWSRVRLSSSRVTTAGPARSSRSRSPRPAGEPSSASPGSCPRGIRSPTSTGCPRPTSSPPDSRSPVRVPASGARTPMALPSAVGPGARPP